MDVGRGARKPWSPLDLKNFSKKDCFLSFEWEKNKFHHFWLPPRKILKKSAGGPFKIFPTTMNTAFGIGDGNNNSSL